ncbi:MAG: uracil-xanthine permease family protein [Clostridia bacterium]
MKKFKCSLTPKDALLSFQHVFAMLGATILVPMLTNMSISVALMSAGIGTLIFYFVTKKKVPVFLGSSFAFLTALQAQMGDKGAIGSPTWNIAMGQLSIAVLCTGMVYVILAIIIRLVGTDFIRKLFPPVVVGPVIIVIGMCLAPTAIKNFDARYIIGATATSMQITGFAIAGIVTAGTIIAVSVFAKGFFKIVPILAGVVIGYVVACCFGLPDFSAVGNNEWILFQPDVFMKTFGWYGTLFSAQVWNKELLGVIAMFAPIAIVTFMEHLGDINASSIVCGKDFIKDPGVHRTLLGDGLATMAAGLVGGPCNTTYGENTAVLSITHNYNPKVLALAAVFAVVLGVFTKVGTLLGTIPAPVIGGASLVLYGMIAANGLKTIVEARVDFSDSKNMIVCSLILVIGIGMNAAGYVLSLGKFVSFSALAVATFVGIIVNAIFMLGSKSKQVSCLSGTYGGELSSADEKKEETAPVEIVAENAVVETAVAEEKTAEKKETIAKEKAQKAKK